MVSVAASRSETGAVPLSSDARRFDPRGSSPSLPAPGPDILIFPTARRFCPAAMMLIERHDRHPRN